MPTEGVLRGIAREVAEYAQEGVAHLDQEVLELQRQLAEKEAERDAARAAPQRLPTYRAGDGGNYYCPNCWIERGVQSALRSIDCSCACSPSISSTMR